MDDCPPQGVRRPDPGVLLELDGYDDMFADALADVRAKVAAAKDRVSVWEPLPASLPETQPCPVPPVSDRGGARR